MRSDVITTAKKGVFSSFLIVAQSVPAAGIEFFAVRDGYEANRLLKQMTKAPGLAPAYLYLSLASGFYSNVVGRIDRLWKISGDIFDKHPYGAIPDGSAVPTASAVTAVSDPEAGGNQAAAEDGAVAAAASSGPADPKPNKVVLRIGYTALAINSVLSGARNYLGAKVLYKQITSSEPTYIVLSAASGFLGGTMCEFYFSQPTIKKYTVEMQKYYENTKKQGCPSVTGPGVMAFMGIIGAAFFMHFATESAEEKIGIDSQGVLPEAAVLIAVTTYMYTKFGEAAGFNLQDGFNGFEDLSKKGKVTAVIVSAFIINNSISYGLANFHGMTEALEESFSLGEKKALSISAVFSFFSGVLNFGYIDRYAIKKTLDWIKYFDDSFGVDNEVNTSSTKSLCSSAYETIKKSGEDLVSASKTACSKCAIM
jgi:hypothetical protein